MRADKFSEAMNGIGDKYIKEAAYPKKRMNKAVKIAGIVVAACAALFLTVAGVGFFGSMVGGMGGASKSADSRSESATRVHEAPGNGIDDKYTQDGYSGSVDYNSDFSYESGGEGYEIIMEPGEKADGSVAGGGMIVYTAEINMTVDNVEQTVNEIDELTQRLGGYYENREVVTSKYPSAYLSVRIPSDKLTEFTDAINATGDVTYFTQRGEDVSEYYRDNEARLETAKAKLKRLQELLGQATDISDIIEIESAIEEAEYEVDYYTGILNGMESKVDYATVSITIDQGEIIAEPDELTFGERISMAFDNGISTFGNFLKNIALFFAAGWLWIILAAVVIFLAIFIPVRISKKKNK